MKISDEVKISDEELTTVISELKKEGAENFYNDFVQNNYRSLLFSLRELQQLREERRWREIGVDEPKTSTPYQVFFGGRIDYESWEYIGDDIWIYGDVDNAERREVASLIVKTSEDFAFRPLPMDLPEVE